MTTPVFDQLAAELPGLVCPLCRRVEFRPLLGANERGADLNVCVDCWIVGRHWPECRRDRTCVDCGKFCLGLDAMVLVIGGGVIPLCREHFEHRLALT